jgi:hypothetical protein
MRTLSLLAGAALALGLSLGTPAQAHGSDARIWVSFGDVAFSAGRPYHRHHHHPLKVTRGRHGPRYYYDPAPAYTYDPAPPPHSYPAHGYRVPTYYRYPPPPPRPGYSRHRPGYYR